MTPDNRTVELGPVSSRFLLEHSKEAMVAAIEIYNKPTISYRNECTVILIVNSWELLLKALLVANKQSIHDTSDSPQRPTRTISWQKAWRKSQQFLPEFLANSATQRNLEILARYRDEAIHYYNSSSLGISLYLLFQAAIVNYRHLVMHGWSEDIADVMTWHLLPIGMTPSTDIVSYLGHAKESLEKSAASRFLAEIHNSIDDLMKSNENVDCFLLTVTVGLESIKKADHADVTVGIDGKYGSDDPSVAVRFQDPNRSHPFRQTEVLAKIEHVGDRRLTSHVFQTIVWKHQLRDNKRYCWSAYEGVLTRYSADILNLIRKLSHSDVEEAINDYKHHLRERRHKQT